MWPQTAFSQRLKLSCPVIQAPMAGGATTPELVAAVSNAGGLGSLAAGYLAAPHITAQIQRIRELTDKPFAVNLFMPEYCFDLPEKVEQIQAIMSPFRKELGISAAPPVEPPPFQTQVEAVLAAKVPVFSFTFGLLSHELIQQFKAQETVLIGTATNLREAQGLQATGIDYVVAQGSEAGGHRGTFTGNVDSGLIGTMSLVPQLCAGLDCPVIAAGGLMDGRSIVAALALGATAVQMGTAFLSCTESGIPSIYRQMLLSQSGDATTLTRAFSGKWARGIRNRFITDMRHFDDVIPDYPVQNGLTRDIRQAATQQERSEFMSLWAGQGVMFSRALSAAELLQQFSEEVGETLSHLGTMAGVQDA
jgi:nitronate monooxygenase